MVALFLMVAISKQLDYTHDLKQSSGQSFIFVYPGEGHYLRFIAPYGIIHMDHMDKATGSVYYSPSGYYSSLSFYSFDSSINSDYDTISSPRVISFGANYGMVYVSSKESIVIYYTYGYSNSTCTQIAVSNADYIKYSYPNKSAFAVPSSTYCFIYMRYGSTYMSYSRNNTGASFYDQLYYSCGSQNGCLNNSESPIITVTNPYQTIFRSSVGGFNYHYSINFSTYGDVKEDLIEGTFYCLSSIMKLYGGGTSGTTSSSNPHWTITSSSVNPSSISSGIITVIVISSACTLIIIVSVIITLIRRNRRRRDELFAVPLVTNPPEDHPPTPSIITDSKPMLQPNQPNPQKYVDF